MSRVESSIISWDSNATDNITRKVIIILGKVWDQEWSLEEHQYQLYISAKSFHLKLLEAL